MSNEQQEKKEEFCGACLTVPIALAAGGGGLAGSSALVDKKKHKTIKTVILVVGITIAVLSISYSLYVLCKRSSSSGLEVCNK